MIRFGGVSGAWALDSPFVEAFEDAFEDAFETEELVYEGVLWALDTFDPVLFCFEIFVVVETGVAVFGPVLAESDLSPLLVDFEVVERGVLFLSLDFDFSFFLELFGAAGAGVGIFSLDLAASDLPLFFETAEAGTGFLSPDLMDGLSFCLADLATAEAGVSVLWLGVAFDFPFCLAGFAAAEMGVEVFP